MSTVEPVEQLRREISSIQYSINSLQSKARLTDVRDAVEDLHTKVNGLPQKVKDLRTRGYVFEKQLESRASDLAQQWASLRPSVLAQIDRQATSMEQAMHPLEHQFRQLVAQSPDPASAQPLVTQIKAEISTLEGKVSAVNSNIRGMYDGLEAQVNEFVGHLAKVDWMLNQLAEATFQMLSTEAGLMAVRATWVRGEKESKDDPQGVLFLTDQRLIFEQKQDVVTKRTLFMVKEKEKVQKVLLEVPVTLVENTTASKRGLLGHEDHIDLTFAADAPLRAAHFHIDGQDCHEWQRLIGRARARDFDQDRAIPLDQTQVEKARSAPSECPNCGAAITKPVLRGMDSIQCEYCGKVIRL